MIIKWSHVDVKRLSLSLVAWWPWGRNSSWVSQFLPSSCGSAYQMAAEWIDSFQGDLSPWWFWQLCFCSVWGPAERGEQTLRCAQLSAQLSASQVLRDVYTEVLEAAHPHHRGPTYLKRSVGPLLSLPEVNNQLFSFAHIQRETVVLAPWCKFLYLIQVCGLIIIGNEAQNHSIISKFDNRCGAVERHAVVCVERVEQGTQDTNLSYVQGDGVGGELAYFHHLRSAGEEVQDPVTEWRVKAEVYEVYEFRS